MAELGGMLAAAVLKVVNDQIGSAIEGQIKLQQDFTEDLQKMKMTLESVEALLEDAERRSITDKSTRLWLNRLKVAMYGISDMIDEFEADTQAFTQPSARKFSLKKHLAVILQPCLTIGPRFKLANKMETMRKHLKDITDEHTNFNFLAGTNASELNVPDTRETISSIHVEIFGRDAERDRILAYLSHISMIEGCSVLAIYGIGGLGKTTLAQMVYNSSQYRDDSRVWVYVSQTFDLMKIGNSIISQLSKNKLAPCTTLQMVQITLLELLAGKKILIVLDDLWELKEDWKKLVAMLHGEGSKVIAIVTTRSEDIAVEVSTNNRPHKLALLENEVCWSIIKQNSDFESKPNKEELTDIGMSIARKCGGVALAAQFLGFVLEKMNICQWRSIRDSDIWSLSDSEDPKLTNVFKSLMLSYSVLPKDLKLCLAYCVIFPKGHQIGKVDLIQQWISLDFIKSTNVSSSWDIGEGYIRQLLGLSFLQDSKSSLAGGVHIEDAIFFTMHDLVHDLARSVMFDEINGGSCSRYALLNDCSKPLESPKIRALRFMDCVEIQLDGAAFSSAKSLRALDLSECSIHKLPDSISVLKKLRYLNAPKIQDPMVPDSITRLSKLTYLNLHGSAISALPESIGDIEGLLYIDLSGCSGIEKLPESFGRLTKSVHLDLSNCSRIGDVSKLLGHLRELQYLNLSHCPNIGESPKELCGLSKLQYLNLSFSSYLESPEAEGFGALTNHKFPQEAEVLGANLEYLNISCECSSIEKLPDALGTFIKLKYLNLSGFQRLRGLRGLFVNLKNLKHLDLSNCPRVNDVVESLGGLTKLEYLNLSIPRQGMFMSPRDQQTRQLRGLPEVISNLTNLRYLNLSSCMYSIFGFSVGQVDSFMYSISTLSNLEHLDLSSNRDIVRIPQSLCKLRKLHTLDLSDCTSLRMIPESIATIDSLKFLYLTACRYLSKPPRLNSSAVSFPHFAVHPGVGESSSNLLRLQHSNPDVLEITRLENVKSPEEAQRIELMKNNRLRKLKLQWTRDAERLVDDRMLLEKLVPPSSLKQLGIQGYTSCSFPAWLLDYLPNLVSIELCNLPNCNVLPPLRQLPNLNWLVLRGLESLEEWNTSYSSAQEHVMRILGIHDCPKLRIKPFLPRTKWLEISKSDRVLSSWGEYTGVSYPVVTTLHVEHCETPIHQWRLLQHLPGLTCLWVTGCGDLTGSPEIIRYLSSVESLELEERDQEELPKWLGELTSLQKLRIARCNELKELPESVELPTKLQSLKLHTCSSITSLPHWLELTPLKKLEMWWCDAIRSLPEGIQRLTNLVELEFHFCSELKWWCESDENKTKLTPNQERTCVLPTSLEKLVIDVCNGINYLPEGIQQLTNLQKLEIYRCPALKKWCESEENKTKLAHIKDKMILNY